MSELDFGFVVGTLVGLGAVLAVSPLPPLADGAGIVIFGGVMCLEIVALAACLLDIYLRKAR